ncbi:putative ultraviolet-B receptor UVR8-like isoform X1 [Capsicum annuum]|nr:putative ultraviolet-B receptor UVR8-like isoform X1 [Capsicum annuum]
MITRYTTVGFGRWKAGGLVSLNTQLGPDPIIHMPENLRKIKSKKKLFHIALTATDSPYSKWQCRIMYYWYRKKKDLPGSEMVKFTRILHSGSPDNLMDEIPTFVVDPLPDGLDRSLITIFVNPLPNLAYGDYPVAFPFFYIKPAEHEEIIRKFFPKENGPVTNIDPIGNSPVIIKKFIQDLLEQVATTWMNVSLRMKHDEETDKTFGWVLEMYAYAVASALHGVQHILRKDFMLQAPWDLETRKKFIIHYTYGCDYNLKAELTYGEIGEWRFDKRSYIHGPLPKNLSLPPPSVPESVVTLLTMINEATANIPNW